MSVVEKIKAISVTASEIAREKPRLTFVSNNLVTAENYISLKHFDGTSIVVEFDDFSVKLSGAMLVIESFTPDRITLGGRISEMNFLSNGAEDVTL